MKYLLDAYFLHHVRPCLTSPVVAVVSTIHDSHGRRRAHLRVASLPYLFAFQVRTEGGMCASPSHAPSARCLSMPSASRSATSDFASMPLTANRQQSGPLKSPTLPILFFHLHKTTCDLRLHAYFCSTFVRSRVFAGRVPFSPPFFASCIKMLVQLALAPLHAEIGPLFRAGQSAGEAARRGACAPCHPTPPAA